MSEEERGEREKRRGQIQRGARVGRRVLKLAPHRVIRVGRKGGEAKKAVAA